MPTADGTVLGTRQIFGTAPKASAFNIVLMADGFTAAEQPSFDATCASFSQAFLSAAPFDQLTHVINVFRVNVASRDSGADVPDQGVVARTYFDSTFGSGAMQRLLQCNTRTALTTATQHVPEFSVGIVVVNSSVYGGSGGGVATFSLAAGAELVAIHEIGHSAFGLADEYAYYAGDGETGHDKHPPGEPREPNVTLNTSLPTLKWRGSVTTALLPTMTNPDCRVEDKRESTAPPGTVSLFEGARYFHCGAYRPEYNCRMRMIDQPFCTVCQQVIRSKIAISTV
jgi:hypothetical protein